MPAKSQSALDEGARGGFNCNQGARQLHSLASALAFASASAEVVAGVSTRLLHYQATRSLFKWVNRRHADGTRPASEKCYYCKEPIFKSWEPVLERLRWRLNILSCGVLSVCLPNFSASCQCATLFPRVSAHRQKRINKHNTHTLTQHPDKQIIIIMQCHGNYRESLSLALMQMEFISISFNAIVYAPTSAQQQPLLFIFYNA